MYSLLGQFWKVFRGYLAFFVTILVIWWAVTTDFTTYITMNVINARWLIIVILSSFFPITMVAYQIFQKEIRYERFLIDIDLLGIPIGEAEKIRATIRVGQLSVTNYPYKVVHSRRSFNTLKHAVTG